VKSLVQLLEAVVLDCATMSGADLTRDVETLRARVECEGDSFITISLPAFCKSFERSLADGRIGPEAFASFKKKRGSAIPAFLQGLLSNVFDQQGELLTKPSTDCIRFVRQICLFGKKIQRPCSKQRLQDAVDGYVRCDDENVSPDLDSDFARVFRAVSREIVGSLRLEGHQAPLAPSHGPGTTQERILGNQKFVFRRWHKRLAAAGFDWLLYGRFSPELHPDEELTPPTLVEPKDESPVRVVFVPKTQKSPRVIAVEPVCMQYAQQAFGDELEAALEKAVYTTGHVNFRDQRVNQVLARDASIDGKLATLDMSEASDRVSLAHVELMLCDFPDLLESYKACRTTRAVLPGGETILLKKFASMGSALCFPIEAMIFFISIISSRLVHAGLAPTRRNILAMRRSVYVYGDDLIVPSDEAPVICCDLETFGFKVNASKSFWTGRFRESCGMDYYDGVCVTPTYLRCDCPSDHGDASALVSLVATGNSLYSNGYLNAFTAIREVVEKILGPLPQVSEVSAGIGWWHHSDAVPNRRFHRTLHRLEANLWVPVTPKQPDPLDGDGALLKCAPLIGKLTLESFPPRERSQGFWDWLRELVNRPEDHLKQSPRPYALALKRRWVPV